MFTPFRHILTGLFAVLCFTLTGCASTTYVFHEGPAGRTQSRLLFRGDFSDKYKGELSPVELARGCGANGLKDVSISYGPISMLLLVFSPVNLDSLDMEYRCKARSGTAANPPESFDRHAQATLTSIQ